MATAARFRIDVAIHDLLMNSTQRPPAPANAGATQANGKQGANGKEEEEDWWTE